MANEQAGMKTGLLFMIDTLEGGGAQKILLYLLEHLDRTKFAVSLLVLEKKENSPFVLPEDVNVTYAFGQGGKRSAGLWSLYRGFRTRLSLRLFRKYPSCFSCLVGIPERYDIGISFCEGLNTPLLWTKKKQFQTRVSWIHTDLQRHWPQEKRVRFLQHMAVLDGLFFVSNDSKRAFQACLPDPHSLDSKLKVVYNPIDSTAIRKQAEPAINPTKRAPLQVLAIGRLSEEKRFDRLLNVHRRLLEAGLVHELLLLGEGDQRPQLEEQIRSLQIASSCELLGFRNPYPYLSQTDVLALTSDYEGMPLVICEAMVLCKPIVATRITGTGELLEDGKYGLLVECSEEALYQGLKKMLEDASLRDYYRQVLAENQDRFVFSSDLKVIEEQLLELTKEGSVAAPSNNSH